MAGKTGPLKWYIMAVDVERRMSLIVNKTTTKTTDYYENHRDYYPKGLP